VKKILFLLLLTSLGLRAQTPPPPAGTDAAPGAQEDGARRVRRALPPGMNVPGGPRVQARPGQPGGAAGLPAGGPAMPMPGGAPGAGPNPANANGEPMTAIEPPAKSSLPPSKVVPAGMIDFRQADVNLVLQLYAEMVNRTILRPATLPAATITLKTQTDLTEKEALQALDASLAMNGIAMIPVDEKFLKAVPIANAGQAGQVGRLYDTNSLSSMAELGSYVTYIVQLHYAKPSEMQAILQPFASAAPNPIMPVESTQMLVLRDNVENVKRMLEMVQRIDQNLPQEYTSEVIPIKYALASDIASALNSLSTGGGGATVGSSSGGGGSRTSSTTRNSTGIGRSTGMGSGMQSGMSGMGGMQSGMSGMQSGATTPGATGGSSSFTDRLRNLISKASSSGDIQVLGQTKIIADERTNSLLVFASREDLKMIKDIISKLDIVLAQVLIEAVVIEVSLSDSKSLGVSYLENQAHGIGNYFSGQAGLNNGNTLNASSFSGTNMASGFNYLAHLGGDLDVSVSAIASDSRARILQRPRIQTSNAKQATLFVGESRPYPTGSYYGGGSYGGYSSIQQMQIGVSLEVTPLINVEGLVVMDIHQKIDSVKETVEIANVGKVPVTSSKEAQASVAVRDKDTIILGGLIESDKSHSDSGVPYLKDIPGLGYLFRSTSGSKSRTELIVLIRPTVLPTPEVAALEVRNQKDQMPGVRDAEREVKAEEAKRKKDSDKRALKETKETKSQDKPASKFAPVD
jgi:general secretion pathway protein D